MAQKEMSPKSKLAAMKEGKKKKDTCGALPPLVSLKCDLCQQYLNDPVTLQCMHSFCRECLEKYNAKFQDKKEPEEEEDDEDAADADENKQEEKEEIVHCPTCTEKLGLAPPLNAQLPFENSRLARIVKLVYDSNVVCLNCQEAASEMKCITCNAWLCAPCLEATHSAPIFETHEKEALSHDQMMALPKCDKHPLNDLEFFSTDEEVGVCQVCLLKGEFVGKPYCLVADVRKARHSDIEAGVEVVEKEKENLITGKLQMESILGKLDNNLAEQQSAVRENFASIRDALNKREKETLQALNALKTSKANVLTKQIDAVDKILKVIDDGVRNVNVILDHSNDLELVYLTIVLQEFIGDLADIDTGKFNDILKKIDYYRSPAVDEELPVVLSDKVSGLVGAYASVPEASLVDDLADGKLKSLGTGKATPNQKAVLASVAGASANADEYGCVIQ